MENNWEIREEGNDRVELILKAHDKDDALNTFADYMERRDVPAFYHRDGAGIPYILAARVRYYAHARS